MHFSRKRLGVKKLTLAEHRTIVGPKVGTTNVRGLPQEAQNTYFIGIFIKHEAAWKQ